MAKKLIQTIQSATHQVKVHFNSEYSEYVASLWVANFEQCKLVKVKEADCFDDDRASIIRTARAMLQSAG